MNSNESLHDIHMQAPVVRLVDTIVANAIEAGASDIHFEPQAQSMRIRFRIDGILHDQHGLIDASLTHRLISRIKVLACIDIAEKRISQDGKFHLVFRGKPIDLRVSTFPSIFGEKIVVRILDKTAQVLNLNSLGFFQEKCFLFQELLWRPQGFLLVCGPTGSGKTTTLYAALSEINTSEKNILTLEDPVEYQLKGITQGQVNSEVGFTFAQGMRCLLRQDPDVIMVGEIRDRETAHIAHEAALTGHLVLSTVHTNDAPSAVTRLLDMHIEPYLISASVTGILAQRLARKICLSCRVAIQPNKQEKLFFENLSLRIDELYYGEGCGHCNGTGYKGRIGIFELLVMTPELRAIIADNASLDRIKSQASEDGMESLLLDGARKVAHGLITYKELLRVVG